jgi:hypothetical protein
MHAGVSTVKKGQTQQLSATVQAIAKKTGRINPVFVAQMMGFPENWLEI